MNIGGGDQFEIPGFVLVDRKVGKEAYPLGYDDGSVDEIRASHILEHFPTAQVVAVVENWVAKLKPGGKLSIAVPDFDIIAGMVANSQPWDRKLIYAYAYGGQKDDNDYHKSAFDRDSLKALMRHCGLRRISEWKTEHEDCARLPVSLNLCGYKPPDQPFPKIRAIMSTGRLGFTENMFAASAVFPSRGIDFTKHTGAFWHQCLDRCITKSIKEEGHEGWFCVLDYDTVFTGELFDELCHLMLAHPEADAIAPWQVKRESDHCLMWMTNEDGTKKESITYGELEMSDLIEVQSAHFGLTLLRASCFETLPRPWFNEQPDAEGGWGEGRTDPDISFWKGWKAAGFKLFLASNVSIGHLQQVATWPSRDLKPIHQYLPDFQKFGPPKEARL